MLSTLDVGLAQSFLPGPAHLPDPFIGDGVDPLWAPPPLSPGLAS